MSRKRILTTERLVLDVFTQEDLDLLFEINSDPVVMKYIAKPDTDKSQTQKFLNETLQFYEDFPGLGMWKLNLKDGTFLGSGLLNHPKLTATGKRGGPVQLGYRIHQAYWNKGYVTEVSKALVDHAFEVLKLERLIALAEPPNKASIRVMEKVGMVFDKITEEFYGLPLVEYYIDRPMWENLKG